jgi:hypothetical protein
MSSIFSAMILLTNPHTTGNDGRALRARRANGVIRGFDVRRSMIKVKRWHEDSPIG